MVHVVIDFCKEGALIGLCFPLLNRTSPDCEEEAAGLELQLCELAKLK